MNPDLYGATPENTSSAESSNSGKGKKDKAKKELKKLRNNFAKVESANKKAGKKMKTLKARNDALEIELKYERALSEEKLHRCRAETTLEVLSRVYANGNSNFPSLRELNAVIVKEVDCDD